MGSAGAPVSLEHRRAYRRIMVDSEAGFARLAPTIGLRDSHPGAVSHCMGVFRKRHRALYQIRARAGRYPRLHTKFGVLPCIDHGSGSQSPGGWSVLALLAILLAQAVLGLFSVDIDGLESGPLAAHVSFDIGRLAAETHETLFNVLLGLIGLHLVAVCRHLVFKRHDLVSPMIRGWRRGERQTPLRFASPWLALAILVCCSAFVWAVVKFAG